MTLPLQMLQDRQPEHSEPASSPTAPTPTPPALEEPVAKPPNRELELAGLQSLMKQHEAVQNSLAINTPKVEINWSTHRKEGALQASDGRVAQWCSLSSHGGHVARICGCNLALDM